MAIDFSSRRIDPTKTAVSKRPYVRRYHKTKKIPRSINVDKPRHYGIQVEAGWRASWRPSSDQMKDRILELMGAELDAAREKSEMVFRMWELEEEVLQERRRYAVALQILAQVVELGPASDPEAAGAAFGRECCFGVSDEERAVIAEALASRRPDGST